MVIEETKVQVLNLAWRIEMANYPADIEQYIKAKVATGEFNSEDSFLCEATRVYRDMETRHQQLKSDVQAAIDEVNSGKTLPMDMEIVKDELAREIDEQGSPL